MGTIAAFRPKGPKLSQKIGGIMPFPESFDPVVEVDPDKEHLGLGMELKRLAESRRTIRDDSGSPLTSLLSGR